MYNKPVNVQLRQQLAQLQAQLAQSVRSYQAGDRNGTALLNALKLQTQVADLLLKATSLHTSVTAAQITEIGRLT